MTEPTRYKTRPDGSIDTAHYMARGREMRSAACWAALGKLRRARLRLVRAAAPGRAGPKPAAAGTRRVAAAE